MKKIFLFGIFVIFIFYVSCKNKKDNKYNNLPPELANYYIEIDKNPKDASLYYKLSLYYIKTKQIDSAFYNGFAALKLDSNNTLYYRHLSDIYFMNSDFESCEDLLERALIKNTKDVEAIMKLAELQLYYKRYKEMEDYLNKALDIDQRNPKAYYMRGFAYKEMGDTMQAIRNLQLTVDQDPEYYNAYIQLGLIFHQKKNKLALDYYKNALNINPKSTEANYNIAMFYQDTKEYEQALDRYKMILEIDNKHKNSYHNIGWIYLEVKNNYSEAIRYFTEAILIDPNFVNALYNRGLAYEKSKDIDKATADYFRAHQIDSEFELAKNALKRLGKISFN